MVCSCCVINCNNRQVKASTIKNFRFPIDQPRRRLWESAIKRKFWTPTASSRVCGVHFKSGRLSHLPNSPDYVPTLNLGYSTDTEHKISSKDERFRRVTVRSRSKPSGTTEREALVEGDEKEATNDVHLSENVEESSIQNSAGNSESDSEIDMDVQEASFDDVRIKTLQQKVTDLTLKTELYEQEFRRLTEENCDLKEKLKRSKFGEDFISRENKDYANIFFPIMHC